MKTFVKRILQGILGFDNYLYIFARYIINTLSRNRKEGDFMHFLQLLKDGDTLLDIGANIGVMTVHLAQKFPHSRILSFEPMPCNIRTFKRIVAHYKLNNVTLFETALGNHEGEVNMMLPTEKKVRMHGLSHVVDSSIKEFPHGEIHRTPLTSLDAIKEIEDLPPVGGIKIDVENYEFFVLDGGRSLIKKYRPLIYIELWDNENRQQCFDLMRGFGYEVKVLVQDQLVAFDYERHDNQNFFFVP